MARIKIQDTAINIGGDDKPIIIPTGSVVCYQAGTSTTIDMYAAETGGSPTSITTDSEGRFEFWIEYSGENRRIKIVITKGGYDTVTIDNIFVLVPIVDFDAKGSLHNNDVFLMQNRDVPAVDPSYQKVKTSNMGLSPIVSTKENWNTTGDANFVLGDFAVKTIGAANHRSGLYVPKDFSSITELVLLVVTTVTSGTADIDIASDYGAAGEAFNTHSESDVASTYNVTSGQLFEIDLSGIFSSLAAGDYCGVQVWNNTGSNLHVVGIRFKYA